MAYRLCAMAFGTLAAISVVLAPSAGADPGQLSGHYIETSVNREGGGTVTNHWFFTSCGQDCRSVQVCDNEKHEGCTSAQARLTKGKWEMDVSHMDVACPDGSIIPDATDFHYTWNPDTLEGVGEGTRYGPGCPVGITPPSATVDFTLKAA
ncbi:Uncharacterised protein [Mycobacteroides abscessus subsp. massiliense]|nr:Uncharacterised protein [Mycobacteroides abscessus subsp. massiliense]